MSLNKVMLIGRLGKEPEVRYTQDNKAIANITLATSETWKDKNTNQKNERTEWHRVVFFGGVAGVVEKYLHKGSQIYIEGKLQTRKWQDKNTGQDRYTTEIVVDSFNGVMQMLDSRPSSGGTDTWDNNNSSTQSGGAQNPQSSGGYQSPQPSGGYQATQNQQPMQPPQSAPVNTPPFDEEFDDDIPF